MNNWIILIYFQLFIYIFISYVYAIQYISPTQRQWRVKSKSHQVNRNSVLSWILIDCLHSVFFSFPNVSLWVFIAFSIRKKKGANIRIYSFYISSNLKDFFLKLSNKRLVTPGWQVWGCLLYTSDAADD